MTKRMLIDATHPEETRVVVMNGNRLEEFDFETSTKKQLKGNIYLAKVTRVEPSLQAAFVDFGGNRHGFLAFNEIHPDYYQIPVADRMALLREEEHAMKAEEDLDPDDPEDDVAEAANGESQAAPDGTGETAEDGVVPADGTVETVGAEQGAEGSVETLGGLDEDEIDDDDDAPERRASSRQPHLKRMRYKIQEVIKRRQILLVQVVKEERGNKGAALTTYLSLAGRYCVLMPNTTKGGGISRKIANPGDRKKLKSIVADLEIPQGIAVILRTAAVERSKAEIKRDFDYLLRTWDQVRSRTLESIAPTLVYEEGNLIKRSIRDLYSKDIDEVLVEGEEGYRTAKEFMRMLMPSHARRVQPYRDAGMPMFHRYQVESQMDTIHAHQVRLKSGGYIVLDPTEALVAIDVNSGRSTRERNIEETAYKTNLEAAEEIARQLRLRDLAGLIVIDFIDMMDHHYQQTVERRLKEAMRNDRARIQIGRISPFGLLELSRQRLRPSLLETSTEPCPTCGGTGLVRSTESAALHVLRLIEEEGIRQRASQIGVAVPTPVALYILNQKRGMLAEIESRYGFKVLISGDDSLIAPDNRIERLADKAPEDVIVQTAPVIEEPQEDPSVEEDEEAEEEARADEDRTAGGKSRSRRRRPRRGKRGGAQTDAAPGEDGVSADADPESDDHPETAKESASEDDPSQRDGDSAEQEPEQRGKPRRRRGKRGGRRRKKSPTEEQVNAGEGAPALTGDAGATAPLPEGEEEAPLAEEFPEAREPTPEAMPEGEEAISGTAADTAAEATDTPKPRRRRAPRRRKAEPSEANVAETADDNADTGMSNGESGPPKPIDQPSTGAESPVLETVGGATEEKVPEAAPQVEAEPEAPARPRRLGWWNRLTR